MTVTSRRWRSWRAKRPAFVDWITGEGYSAEGRFLIPERASLGLFLAALPHSVERVYIVGTRIGETPDGLREWMTAKVPGWSTAPDGHYLERGNATMRFLGPAGRRKVEVHPAAMWFGHGSTPKPADAFAAWTKLGYAVAAAFDGGVLLATPATTGRDLFVRSLGDRQYPVADPEHQAIIRSTTGQGRDQLLASPSPGVRFNMPGLAEYDGRLMYGALCNQLGSGVERDDDAVGRAGSAAMAMEFNENPYVRGRYLVDWRVPHDWAHVGLAGVWTGSGWSYPSRQDDFGTSWLDGAELLLLARHGWPFRIQRRLLLHQPSGPGPLDVWARKLVNMRLTLAGDAEHLAAAGARSILLNAIGAFMGSPHVVTRTAPLDEPEVVPRNAVNPRVEGDSLVWGEERPAAWPELSHPEWSAAIWARCRARLLDGPRLTGALHVPARSVVAFRTDALYLTERPDWPDDGRAGRLRLVSWLPGPIPWPATKPELLRLREKARAQ